MNENTDNIKGPLILVVVAIAAYFVYEAVETIAFAIGSFLFGLVTIGLVAAAILIGFLLFRYIVEKQYGDDFRMRKVQRLEEKYIRDVCQAPDNMKEPIRQWHQQRKENVYRVKTEAKFDTVADRTKQVINIFRRDK